MKALNKNIDKKFPTKSERENQVLGLVVGKRPILKTELRGKSYLHVLSVSNHHRINPIQRFDLIFGINIIMKY